MVEKSLIDETDLTRNGEIVLNGEFLNGESAFGDDLSESLFGVVWVRLLD